MIVSENKRASQPGWQHPLLALAEEELDLVLQLVLASGSLKDLALVYQVSYPISDDPAARGSRHRAPPAVGERHQAGSDDAVAGRTGRAWRSYGLRGTVGARPLPAEGELK